MIKRCFLALSLGLCACSTFANNARQGFYIGAFVGGSYAYYTADADLHNGNGWLGTSGSALVGYQFNQYVASEVAVNAYNFTSCGVSFTLKGMLPLTSATDIFANVGAAINPDFSLTDATFIIGGPRFRFNPIFKLGVETQLTNHLSVNLAIQSDINYVHDNVMGDKQNYKMFFSMAGVGLNYYF